MRRQLLNAAALLSLSLCLFTLMAAARGVARADWFRWLKLDDRGARYFEIALARWGLGISYDVEVYEKQNGVTIEPPDPEAAWLWQGHGVGPARRMTPPFNSADRTRFGFWLK
jgi:hypothetical protein